MRCAARSVQLHLLRCQAGRRVGLRANHWLDPILPCKRHAQVHGSPARVLTRILAFQTPRWNTFVVMWLTPPSLLAVRSKIAMLRA